MPGASEEARRVKIMNANWIAGADGDDGDFELMIVTSDDRHHVVAPSPPAMTALVALAQTVMVLVWDRTNRRLMREPARHDALDGKTQPRRVPEAALQGPSRWASFRGATVVAENASERRT